MRVLAAIFFAASMLLAEGWGGLEAHADGGPDSIYVPGKGYVERWERPAPVKRVAARKPKTAKIAGHSFRQTPNVVSWHSDASGWIAEARRYQGMNARQIGLSRTTLWCGTFLAEATSLPVPKWNYHWADNWRLAGRKISNPKPGAIALISYGRRGRGPVDHVGIVTGVDPTGQGFGGHFRAVQGFRYAEGM